MADSGSEPPTTRQCHHSMQEDILDVEERGDQNGSNAPLLQINAEAAKSTLVDSKKSASARLSALFGVAKKNLLVVGILTVTLFIPIVALLENRAMNLELEIQWMRLRERAPNSSESLAASQLCSPPPAVENRDVSDLVFIPKGSWVEAGESYAYMETTAKGVAYSKKWKKGDALKMMGGKWVYFWGDSTMRQIFIAFVTEFFPFQYTFEEARDLFRAEPPQRGRTPFIPLPNDPTPCFINEHTLDQVLTSESGTTVRMTYNWKHLIYDEYDEYFFREELLTLRQEHGKFPDVIIVSTGLHSCFHNGASGKWENQRDLDSLLARVGAASREYALPPIVWIDNVRFIGQSGNPEASEVFNKYYRSRIIQELKVGGHKGALVGREELGWTAPEKLWEDTDYRIHLSDHVQAEIVPYVLNAMKALGMQTLG